MSERITPFGLQPEQNILKEKLLNLCPEIFQDGKLNIEALQSLLPDEVEGDDDQSGDSGKEHFGLSWPGKNRARQLALKKPMGSTLKHCPGEGVSEDTTQNIFIEGDNLEVLKLLREAYADQVKMIYIDPPYNTGTDMIYEDNFAESLDDYLAKIGQKEGKTLLVANPKSAGRFHSKWLSSLYPRLRIGKDLLHRSGVVLVSIDDNEMHHLRSIMNEIYGDENYVGTLVWEKKKKGAFLAGSITNIKEYILVYSKDKDEFKGLIGEIASEEETYPVIKTTNSRGLRVIPKGIKSKFSKPNHVVPAGSRISSGNMEMILRSDMIIKDGMLVEDVEVDSNWIYSQRLITEYGSKGELYVTQDLYFRRIVKEPRFKKLKDILPRQGDESISGNQFIISDNLQSDGWGTNEDGNAELHELLGVQNLFDFPKPAKLIAKLIHSIQDNEALIMDFFAGSGTTAHAVMDINRQDGGKRKYICVQLPVQIKPDEEAHTAGYHLITELTKDRIRRVIKQIELQRKNQLNFVVGEPDFGFKVLKLGKTNFNIYKNHSGNNTSQLTLSFQQQTDKPLVDGWTKPDLITELMLLEGFPLHSRQEPQSQCSENEVVAITSDFNENTLYVCLDAQLQEETVESLSIGSDDIFVCLDSSLTDVQKVRLDDKLKLKTV